MYKVPEFFFSPTKMCILLTSKDNVDSQSDINKTTLKSLPGSNKRRRTYDAVTPELTSYPRKRRMIEILEPLDAHSRDSSSFDNTHLQHTNLRWVLNHLLQVPHTPMWVRFQSFICKDNSCQQKVSYLTSINVTPTKDEVVVETVKRTLMIANECNEPDMQVTYDLPIAKVAFRIQTDNKPTYDNLFIHLGAFHIMMVFFKELGYSLKTAVYQMS